MYGAKMLEKDTLIADGAKSAHDLVETMNRDFQVENCFDHVFVAWSFST